ncbi:MAG: hypothetical protein Q7U57_05795 [Methylovulum sp.]|nr:hypothetical protein [Methylovulum sp.]
MMEQLIATQIRDLSPRLSHKVTIQPLAVGRAARAINGPARYPRAGEGARGTPYASGKDLPIVPTLCVGTIGEQIEAAIVEFLVVYLEQYL